MTFGQRSFDRRRRLHGKLGDRRRADAALLHALRIDLKNRRAEPRDAILHGILGAVAQCDHRDDGGDADHDAKHRQERTKLIGAQRRERDAEGFVEKHGAWSRDWLRKNAAARSVSLHHNLDGTRSMAHRAGKSRLQRRLTLPDEF